MNKQVEYYTDICCVIVKGCFWGVENYFNKHFKQGLISSEVGYCGGEAADPNYRQVRHLPPHIG